jgi:hypothetical protein
MSRDSAKILDALLAIEQQEIDAGLAVIRPEGVTLTCGGVSHLAGGRRFA